MTNDINVFINKIKESIENLINVGKLNEAKELMTQYEHIFKMDEDIYSFKGIIAMIEGRLDDAENALLQGISLYPENIDLLCNLGFLYSIKKDYELSIGIYNMALGKANSKELQEEIIDNIEKVKMDYEKLLLEINHYREIEFKNRFSRINLSKKQELVVGEAKENIHVVYVLNHVGVCGGVKIIFEQANRLVDLGVQVTLISHYPRPRWYPLKANYIMVECGKDLVEGIPDCDVIVATYWDHIQACIETNKAPVVYFEQGDFHLFDVESIPKNIFSFIKRQFELPKFIITVSNNAAKAINKTYSRKADIIYNAVDKEVFNVYGKKYDNGKPYILMIGSDQVEFKRLDDVISAYKILKNRKIDLDLIWITPTVPSKEYKEVSNVFINPSQEIIAELYRGAFVFVSASLYESFSLPILEAMSCGCPVITTPNEGAKELVQNNKNGLFVEKENPLDIAKKIELLVKSPNIRTTLISNGLETAKNYSWDNSIKKLLDYLKNVAQYTPVRNDLIENHININ